MNIKRTRRKSMKCPNCNKDEPMLVINGVCEDCNEVEVEYIDYDETTY